ncbi:DUF3606 domain-containing protein [Variovorax ginsengisoli]|uniref:DUF3606 domain-containing protein n=1 Tax=Variovorax ginsengisoli TaxID=363844 RepID=A0ABT9S8T3_9BURK|nr:DUF3606 domain-containing protein [Variovorax ginsengisoli]MDP9900761.1 hypothetical protein [Variovorax ginsengisoli]
MTDDLKNAGPQDRSRVNINEAHEVAYWTAKWGVTEAELRSAVADVGVSAEKIGIHLGAPPAEARP